MDKYQIVILPNMVRRHGESSTDEKCHISKSFCLMEAIILAGGFGTRLQSVVPHLPKPMAPINGRPFLEILLQTLANNGFYRVILSVGYMANTIITYFGPKFQSMELVYHIEEMPLGTGGAVRQALTECFTDHVFIFNGDTYLNLEVSEVEAYWQRHRSPIIVARKVSNTSRYGRLITQGDLVTGFAEKGITGSGLINAGCYVFPVNSLAAFELGQPFSLETEFLVNIVKKKKIHFFLTKGHFIDIGTPEDFKRAQSELV